MTFKSATQPLCRQCAKPIAKATRTVYCTTPNSGMALSSSTFSRVLVCDPRPTNKAECQKLTNWELTSLSYSKSSDEPRTVWAFNEWDGESWKDQFFCTNNCAVAHGYMCARDGMVSHKYNETINARSAK